MSHNKLIWSVLTIREARSSPYRLLIAMFFRAHAYGINQNVYNPDKFIPEKEKNPNVVSLSDPSETIFDFGRQRCPGKHLASTVLMN